MPLYRAELLAKKPLPRAALIHDVTQVLHLPFDYDDGSYARDRSGYDRDGIIYGATRVAGLTEMALRFDGLDDYVKVPYRLSLTEAVTVVATFKLLSLQSGWRTIARKSEAAGTWDFGIGKGENHRFRGWILSGGVTRFAPTGPVLATNKWYYGALT